MKGSYCFKCLKPFIDGQIIRVFTISKNRYCFHCFVSISQPGPNEEKVFNIINGGRQMTLSSLPTVTVPPPSTAPPTAPSPWSPPSVSNIVWTGLLGDSPEGKTSEPTDIRAERKKAGVCLECGDRGYAQMMAWFCSNGHGRIF